MLIKESDDFSDLRVGGSPPRLTPPPSFDFIDNGKRDYPRMPAFQFRPVFTRAECEMIPEEEESPRRNPRLLMKSWVNKDETMPLLPKGAKHVCKVCGIKFNNPSNLEVHLTLSHCNKFRISKNETQDSELIKTGSKKRGIEEETSPQDSPKVFKTDAGHLSPKDLKTTTLDSDKAPVNRQRKESPPLTGAFRCQMCSYTADKQSRLVDHMSKEHPEETGDSNSEMEVDAPPPKPITPPGTNMQRNEPTAEWFCEQCDIRFSALSNYRAHKEFYCGTRARRKSTGSPAVRQTRSPKYRSNSMGLYPGYVPTIVPTVMPVVPPGMQLVPMLTPFGMTYAMQCVLPPNAQQPSPVKSASPKAQVEPPTPKSANDNDQPLDLSVKKEDTSSSDDSGPKAKNRRTSDPGAYLSRFNNWSVNNPPRFYSPVATLSSDKRQSITSGGKGLIPPVVLPNMTTDVSRCDECDIVFYKHENYKVHKELYCAGRRGKDNLQIRPNLKTPSPKPSAPRADKLIDSPNAKSRKSSSPALSTMSVNSRDASTPEEYAMQYFCVPCNIKFSSLDTLEAHQLYYCPASKALAEQASLTPSLLAPKPALPIDEKQAFTCVTCSASFATKNDLAAHMCTHTTMKIPMFCCPYCDYVAQSDNRLLDHIKAHAPTKAYRCDLCGYRGNTVRGMRMHGKTHVDAGQDFTDDHMIEYDEPPLIPKRLRTVTESVEIKVPSELLRVNMEQIRKRSRGKAPNSVKHFCPQCRVIFPDSFALQAHMRVHADDAQNACKDSDLKITQVNLNNNLKVSKSHVGNTTNELTASEERRLSKHTIKNILDDASSPINPSIAEDQEYESHSSDEENKITHANLTTKVSQPAKRPGTPLSPKKENILLSNNASPATKNDDSISDRGNYCKQCDIPFVYMSTYLAHKKYYCSSHAGERNGETPAKLQA